MKTVFWVTSLLLIGFNLLGQTAGSANGAASSPVLEVTPYAEVLRDANSSVWERTVYEPGPSGKMIPHTHRYTEMATGLHYKKDGQWVETKEKIDILPTGGAAATQGQHQAYFPSDIYDGEIRMVTPTGNVLRSRPLGLSYDDGTNTVLISELKNSIGQVMGSNQVIYPDAFTDFKADLRYTYTKDGFEQDVILREAPRLPEAYGLNVASTRLQVLTEFFSSPQPAITSSLLPLRTGSALMDQTLDFGDMGMIRGRAFLMETDAKNRPVRVNKQWLLLDGRQFLVEEVLLDAIVNDLTALPQTALNSGSVKTPRLAARRLALPPQRLAKKDSSKAMMLAKNELPARGFVLDYQTVNGTLTNFTFQGDTTYFISSHLTLSGTNIVEGGAVIKFTNSTTGFLQIGSAQPAALISKAGPYRMAVFTSMNDNSVGEAISGSSGSPTTTSTPYLQLFYNSTTLTNILSYLRFAYAGTAIAQQSASTAYTNISPIWNCQFVNCANAIGLIDYDDLNMVNQRLYNVLFANCGTAVTNLDLFYSGKIAISGQNITADHVNNLLVTWSGDNYATSNSHLTNCVLTSVGRQIYFEDNGTGTSISTNACFISASSTGIYQAALGGNYYLTNGSSFRNAGTTNIDASLLAQLRQKTTYPPIVYSNTTFATNTTFNPQAQRDVDTPDLGYHYEPLDYIFGGVYSNANLTFSAGTAVGWFRTSSGFRGHGQPLIGYGIHMADTKIADFQGTETAPDYWVRCNTVQEQDLSGKQGPGGLIGTDDQNNQNISLSAEMHLNFTRCTTMASDGGCLFRDDWGYLIVKAKNSEFYNGNMGGYIISCDFTNCLMDRMQGGQVQGLAGDEWIMRNCTWHGGLLYMSRSGAIPVSVRDCAFDSASYTVADIYSTNSTYTDYDFNAYTNATDPFPIGGTNDKRSVAFNWQTGPLGLYYLPVNSVLTNAGDATASTVGLYHFTTQTNQVKETNSIVDLGYHFVALDANGNVVDTDGDGIPDYIEDPNGNGTVDPGESSWLLGINSQPQSQNVVQGINVTFSVGAGGAAPFYYRWWYNGAPISGATSSNLTKLVVTTNDEGNYFAVVTNSTGSVTSSVAVLTVNTPVRITAQPADAMVLTGATTNFSVGISGNHTVYRWYGNSTPLVDNARISGSITANLTLSSIVPTDTGPYYVVVTNLFNSVTSSPAALTVITNPYVASPPTNTTAIQSDDVTLSATVNGISLFYQWWLTNSLGTTNIWGANSATYSKLVVVTNDAGHYSLVVTNPAGSTNVNADLTVLVPPWITQQPTSIITNQGNNVTFSVSAFGTTSLFYQWYKNGTNLIANATNSSFTLNNVQGSDAAGYSVLITNIAGTNFSAWAWLSVILTGGGTNNGWGTGSTNSSTVTSMIGPTNSSPTNPAIYLYGPPISIRSSAFNLYNNITNVAFYFTGTNYVTNFLSAGNAVFGANTKFAVAWTNALHGTNILKARSWDRYGNMSDSSLVYVIMDVAPQITTLPSSKSVVWEGFSTNVWFTNYVSDDGYPYGVTNIYWNVPAGVTTSNLYTYTSSNIIVATLATFTNSGSYSLVLSASDGFVTNSSAFTATLKHRPVVSFNWPTNNTAVLSNTPIVLNAIATDPDGVVTNVTFYDGSKLGDGVQTLSNAYNYAWYGAPVWTNLVSAVAWDNDGLTSTSTVTVVVFPPLAVRILAPSNTQTLLARSSSSFTATVTNIMPGETIAFVEFFVGAQSIGFASSPSNSVYYLTWIPSAGGTYALTAVAFPNGGGSVSSSPVSITVIDVPFIRITSPTNTQVYPLSPTNLNISATVVTNGAPITNVTFYEGTNFIATTNSGNPYTVRWLNVTNGIYHLNAKAIDTRGLIGFSSNITVIVEPANRAPSVYPGRDQTVYLSTNAVLLRGLVTDDGLPFGSTLSVNWTNLNGGTNVTFVNSNLPVTSVYFWSTGTYTLRLSASDSQFAVSSNVVFTVLPTNRPPQVNAGTNQTLILPAAEGSNAVRTIEINTVLGGSGNTTVGLDYYMPSNCVIASIMTGAVNTNLFLIFTNGTTRPFSSATNFLDETYISTVRSTSGGFNVGEMFCGNSADGQVMRIEPDGTIIGTNAWVDITGHLQTNSWVVLSRTNADGSTNQGSLRGGLWVDRTGVWGGDLIVSCNLGYVWRVNSAGKATFVAYLDNPGAFQTYEGVTTIPNDVQKYGPWAGRIVIGGDDPGSVIYAVDTNGIVTRFNIGVGGEDIRVIPKGENFFALDATDNIYESPASEFSGMAGDILISDERSPNYLYRVRWNGDNFDIYPLSALQTTWEGVNFVPTGLFSDPPSNVHLYGTVTDDGEILSSTTNWWSVISSNGPVDFLDASRTNTIAEFSVPGDYTLQLSAYDGQYTSSSNVVIHVLQNQPPSVSAGTNRSIITTNITLQGSVSDDGLPYNITNISWSIISAPDNNPSYAHFASTSNPTSSVHFDSPGVYIFRLTADDGQVSSLADVTITVQSPMLTLTPTNALVARTNTTFTVSGTLLNTNGSGLGSVVVHFSIDSGPDAGYAVDVSTAGSGLASFTYTNASGNAGRDVISAYVDISGLPRIRAASIYKDWGLNIGCGGAYVNQSPSDMSREFPTNAASYYFYAASAGQTIELLLTQRKNPLILILRDTTTDTVVAESPVEYIRPGDVTSLKYTCTHNGDYVIEVASIDRGAPGTWNQQYDLQLNCLFGPAMQILYNGSIIPNGGAIVFPQTALGTSTNILLSITNAGDSAFTIAGVGTNGDFTLTNNVLGKNLAPGAITNLGVKFNATSNGVSFGALALVPSWGTITNYVVYFMASTAPTSAVPTIEWNAPTNGSTFVDSWNIFYSATVTSGSAAIQSVQLEMVTTNGIELLPGYVTGTPLIFDSGSSYTNTYPAIRVTDSGPDGDFAIVAVVSDFSGQTNMTSPLLIHIVPTVDVRPPVFAKMQVLLYGTNVANGGTITFPQTFPGQPTNLTLVVSNAGQYPLSVTNISLNGDFRPLIDDVSNLLDSVVAPGSSTNLELFFNASSHGTSVGELTFLDNEANDAVFSLFLVGNAYNIDEGPGSSTNLPPVLADDEFTVEANSRGNILRPLTNDYDPNGDSLKIVATATTGTGGGTIAIVDNGREISYTPPPGIRSNPGFPGDGFYYGVVDGRGGSNWATVYIDINASDIPEVFLSSSPSDNNYATNAGAIVPLTATVTNSPNIVRVDFYLGTDLIGTVTNGVNGQYVLNWIALYDNCHCAFTAVATDKYGQMATSNPIHITIIPPPGAGVLTVVLDKTIDASSTNLFSPTSVVLLRDGLFNLYGRATNSVGSNVVWQLGVYGADGTLIRDLTPSSTAAVGTAGTSGVLLSNCDLTTLQNGIYQLKLVVTGGNQMADTNVQIQLESNLKIGQFSFSQQDLVIPLSGIPLTVTRTYNSLNPDRGDFGYSWTYTLNDMDVAFDETREDIEDTDGNIFSQRTGGGRDVTLTLPNGQRTTFYFTLTGGVLGTYEAEWLSAPGVTATLTCQGDNHLQTLFGGLDGNSDLYYWQAAGQDTPMEAYDFPGYILTTKDGTVYTINRDDLQDHFVDDGSEGYYVQAYGDSHLSTIKTRVGDTTQINLDSVVFTATNGVSHQITFERNDAGLIKSVDDPAAVANPSSPPTVKYEYDSLNNLIAVEHLTDRIAGTYVTNSFSYTNTHFPHYITGIFNGDGTQVAKNFYDDSGKLTAVQDADGNLTKFVHNPTNDMEVIIDRRGYTNTYVYDLRGNVTAQTNQVGQITTMAYDVFNNKTNEVTYLNGAPYATNRYVYDTNLNVMLVSYDPLGHSNAYAYDGFGQLTNSTDALNNGTTNVYDGSGNQVAIIDALGHASLNAYSGSLLLGSVDAARTVTTNAYDGNNNIIGTAVIDSLMNIVSSNSYTYDDNNNQLTSTVWRRVNGTWTPATTTNIYDAMNRVVQTISPNGGTNSSVYDENGRQQATTDALGRMTSYTYDSQERLIRTTYPDNTTEQFTYDPNGNRSGSVDRAGHLTTYVYDALNRIVQTIYPDKTTNTTVYDGVGRVAQTIAARGIVTAFAYDAAGRRLAVTNAAGTELQMVSQYVYDANGNQTIFIDATNHSTTNVFDVLNRQVKTLYSDGTSNSLGFDVVDRKVGETNQDGIVTLFGYDGAGRLTAVTNALGKAEQMVTRYRYDEAGNEVAQIDALGRTNIFLYDNMGRRVLHTRPDAQSEGFTYDLAGNLVYQTNFNSNIIFNEYNELNRLTNRSVIGIGQYASFTYTATGQRASTDSLQGAFVCSYEYDGRDRLVRKTSSWNGGAIGAGSLTAGLSYGYDADGNLTNLSSSMANGVGLSYGYDALNRITNVLSRGQLAASYTFDAVGNLQGMKYGNGVTNIYQYDSLNRLTNLVWKHSGTALGNFYYQLGKTGNRTNLAETVNAVNRSYSWVYDNLYRMTNETIGGIGGVGYQFDRVGNRTNRNSTIGTLPTSSYAYDTNDWLTTDQYDYGSPGNGNTTSSGGNSYDYDPFNRLLDSNPSGVVLVYDADGNRISKTTNSTGGSVTIYYQVDDRNPTGYSQVVEEYCTTPANYSLAFLNKTYNYGLTLISQQQMDTRTLLPSMLSYYGMDGHGSVRFLTDTNGNITDTCAYDAYGTIIASSGSTPNNYLYTGEQYDPDLGLYYLRARYYKSDTGRFWTGDSFQGQNESPLSLHKYLYCNADPLNAIDPSGLKTVIVITDDSSFAYAAKPAAKSAASHLQAGGWTVVYMDVPSFINNNQQYDGIITSGHGSATLSVTMEPKIIQTSLELTHSRLEVGIFLSCHSTEYATSFLSAKYSTDDALFITYSGYATSVATRRWRVGRRIDKWLARPQRTEYDLYNPAADLIGTVVIDGIGGAWNLFIGIANDFGAGI